MILKAHVCTIMFFIITRAPMLKVDHKELGAARDVRRQRRLEVKCIEPGEELAKLKSQFLLLVNNVISSKLIKLLNLYGFSSICEMRVNNL